MTVEPQIAMDIFDFQEGVLNQGAPVQNTWYTIGSVMINALIYQIAVNVEDTNETLEVRILINGETIDPSNVAATHSTTYNGYIYANAVTRGELLILNATAPGQYRGSMVQGKSVEVQVRKTTAAGVGNLTGLVVYGVKKSV